MSPVKFSEILSLDSLRLLSSDDSISKRSQDLLIEYLKMSGILYGGNLHLEHFHSLIVDEIYKLLSPSQNLG